MFLQQQPQIGMIEVIEIPLVPMFAHPHGQPKSTLKIEEINEDD
jgi:hypothetical protein